ncbi:MAG: hypothetical protein ACOX6E_09260 [Syntrophomonadaceae bacterium]|jgi:hypothetical protein
MSYVNTKKSGITLVSTDGQSYHTYTDLGMILTSAPVVNPPELQTETVKVPGRDGLLDLSEALTGRVAFGNRSGSWTFFVEESIGFHKNLDRLANLIHGKRFKCIFDIDPEWYYKGRLNIDKYATEGTSREIQLNYDLDPYKYAVSGRDIADWLWDPFNFVSDTIYFGTFSVSGTRRVNLINPGKKNVVPTFKVTGTVNISFRGYNYQMTSGTHSYSELYLSEGDNWLTFTGTGTVKVGYERTSL